MEVFLALLSVILMLVINIVLLIGPLFLFYKIGKVIGNRKFKKQFNKEVKKISLQNPYLYFRDIPNQYGIGVAAYILGYKIEYKDVIACIIDLSAKKYINLVQKGNTYEIINNNKDMSNLLKNEKFLLEWLLTSNTKFNIDNWKYFIKEDVVDLGLIDGSIGSLSKMQKQYSSALSFFPSVTSFKEFMNLKISKISILLIIILGIILFNINKSLETIIIYIIISPFIFGISFIVLFFVFLPLALFIEGKFMSYKEKRKYFLKLNDIGKQEYHELYSLAKFLNDFGDIANKHVEEVIIWEQYLSYSILFRINKKIVSCGYDKIIKNNCFTLTNVEKIRINRRIIKESKLNNF